VQESNLHSLGLPDLTGFEGLFRPGGSAIARALDATAEQRWDAAAYTRKIRALGSITGLARARLRVH
jgi:hypothetical protein